MAALLSSHLEQIATCGRSIAELPFPGPKAFTNAILSTSDITRLIRDTEAHERALYHLAPPDAAAEALAASHHAPATQPSTAKSRRTTVYASRQPRNKAVATVLGGDLYEQIQRQPKGEVDVELLLHGAKKLANVYPMPGTLERITKLQKRYQQLNANIAHYETRVAEQKRELEQMGRPAALTELEEEDEEETMVLASKATSQESQTQSLPAEGLESMQDDIQALELRKQALEDRVSGMDRDLNELAR